MYGENMGSSQKYLKMLIFNMEVNGKDKNFDINDEIQGTSALAKLMIVRYMM